MSAIEYMRKAFGKRTVAAGVRNEKALERVARLLRAEVGLQGLIIEELREECSELRGACTTLRWMLGADRCNRCDEACTMEESGLCPLDERLGALGVPVPGVVDRCHVSQCQEEDR